MLYDDVENGGRAVWDDSQEQWKIPGLILDDANHLRERSMTKQSHHRPETEHARRQKMVDPNNPRWHTEDIVDLDLIMPSRSTPAIGDPNTTTRIQNILSMDINDELPSSKGSSRSKGRRSKQRQDKYFSATSDGRSSRSRRDKSKQKPSSSSRRPTTAF